MMMRICFCSHFSLSFSHSLHVVVCCREEAGQHGSLDLEPPRQMCERQQTTEWLMSKAQAAAAAAEADDNDEVKPSSSCVASWKVEHVTHAGRRFPLFLLLLLLECLWFMCAPSRLQQKVNQVLHEGGKYSKVTSLCVQFARALLT